MTDLQPFRIDVSQSTLDDLAERLGRTRFPNDIPGVGWRQGTELGYLREIVRYWLDGYDWRAHEARINRYDQVVTAIDGQRIHCLHVRSPHVVALPLVLTHGWPGSLVEFLDVIDPLTNPADPADAFHVIVPSLPGFPGGDRGHTVLDSHLDWVLAVRHLLQRAGLEGADLAGSSVGGAFAAEIAAIWPNAVRRLALIAPWGLFDEKDPMTDPWAQRPPELPALLCADPERWNQLKAEPEGVNSPEWPIEQTRSNEAAARAFWPLGNTRLEKRLALIEAPTLLICPFCNPLNSSW